jgi:hypothetical protein
MRRSWKSAAASRTCSGRCDVSALANTHFLEATRASGTKFRSHPSRCAAAHLTQPAAPKIICGSLGGVPERLKGADCKSVGLAPTLVRIQPPPPADIRRRCGCGSVSGERWGRTVRWEAGGHGRQGRRATADGNGWRARFRGTFQISFDGFSGCGERRRPQEHRRAAMLACG